MACPISTPSIRGNGIIHSRTAVRLIKEWCLAHRVELEANWHRFAAGEPLERIAPLDCGVAMNELPAVVLAEYRSDFKIRVVFNDGVDGTIDFTDWLTGPVFEPLKDRS